MATLTDIAQDCLEKIGVYAPGETMSDADAQRCKTVINDMLDSWSNESLTCFAILEQSFPLVVGQLSFTLGSGGNVPVRPIRLIEGPGAAYLTDTNGNRYPVDVVPQDKWNQIWNITNINSNLPSTIFYDPQFPLGVIKVYPLYSGGLGITLYWDSYLQLTEFADLTTDYTFPPGYVKAIKDVAALELWPYFKPDGSQPSALLVGIAASSKGNIKRSNIRISAAQFDVVLTGRGGSAFNIYSDSAR